MKEFYLDSCGGGRLHCAIWTPEGEPKAVVQLIHGIAEHIGRYDDFARFLNAHGYVVAADDHMGHGGSVENGVKGYFSGGWLSAVEDEKRLHDEIAAQYPALPYYILGHSMGSFLLREMLQGFEKKLDKFLQENYITLRDNQYDALISLTYNIGSGWMKESALATLLKNGTYSNNELASAIGIWCHVKSNGVTSIHDGLVARRISEINVFLYGDYSGEATGFYSVRFEQTEKGDRARDIAFYEAGSAYDPAFEATSDDGEIFLGWYTEDGTLLTDLRATQDLTVTARWESDNAWV